MQFAMQIALANKILLHFHACSDKISFTISAVCAKGFIMAFLQVNLKLMNTVLIILGIVLVIGVLAVVAYKMARTNAEAKRAKAQKQQEAEIKRVEEQTYVEANRQLVLARNVTYNVGLDGEIAMGTYVLKSARSGHKHFNVRLNGLVSKYSDGETVVLGAGDTICVVSSSAVLQPQEAD